MEFLDFMVAYLIAFGTNSRLQPHHCLSISNDTIIYKEHTPCRALKLVYLTAGHIYLSSPAGHSVGGPGDRFAPHCALPQPLPGAMPALLAAGHRSAS